jgi:hypothetical protein
MNFSADQANAILQDWQKALIDVLNMLLHSPNSNLAFWLFLLVTYMSGRWAFMKVAQTMNLNDLGMMRFHVAIMTGYAAILLPLAGAQIYRPEWLTGPDQLLYLLGITGAASLVLSVPIINGMMKDNFFKTLMAWGVSLVAVAGAIVVLGLLSDAFFSGVSAYKKGYERNEETKKVVK